MPTDYPRTMSEALQQAVITLAVGAVLLGFGVWDVKFWWDMDRFVEGEATLTSLKARGMRKRFFDTRYNPRVEYEFHVDGRCVRGNRLMLGWPSVGSSGEALQEVKEAGYMVGSRVPVYYDAGNPGRSILIRDVGMWWYVVTGSLVVFGGAGLAWGGQRAVRMGTSAAYRERLRQSLDRKRARGGRGG